MGRGYGRTIAPYPSMQDPRVTDSDAPLSREYYEAQLALFHESLTSIVNRLAEKPRTFDSYRPQSLAGEVTTSLNIPSDYSLQEVRSVIVTGPTINSPTGTIANPTPAQPAVPATGVAIQNTNPYPVLVVISANGATITNVTVSGQTVGTAAGTYIVPSAGTISIAYTVATPTWVWSDANPPATFIPPGTPFTLQLGDRAWSLILPNTGILSIRFNPGLELKQSDDKLLTSATAGNWAVELTGYRNVQS